MKFIIGEKLDMTQVWQGDTKKGVTRIKVGPCMVTQVKTDEQDGYQAVQLGYGNRKNKNINKAQKGHTKDLGDFKAMREFRLDKINNGKSPEFKKGDTIDVSTFAIGDIVQVTSISKGKGFQGVVKRHGFHGQDKTHGNKDQLRMPGSAGATGPAHVFKGQKMPGRMGNEQVTIKNIEIVDIDEANQTISINGSVPGARNSLVLIAGIGELILASDKKEVVEESKEEVKEEVKEEKVEEPKEEEKKDTKEVKKEAPAKEEK